MKFVDKFFNIVFKHDSDKKEPFIAPPSYEKPSCVPLFMPPPPPYSQEQQRATLLDDAAYRQSVAEWYLALRRRRLLTSLCAALLILWLLLAAIAGSLLLFKYLHRKPVYYGWCGTTFLDDTLSGNGRSSKPLWGAADRYASGSGNIWKGNGNKLENSLMSMRENLEIDETNEYEKIEVPQFGPYRPALFVHDFRQNLTAIIDVRGENCFIKPLDRSQIVPPSGFIDMIRKVGSGYYDQNSKLIREVFDVRLPALTRDQLTNLNSWIIKHQCYSMTSYMLQKSQGGQKKQKGRHYSTNHRQRHHEQRFKDNNSDHNNAMHGRRRFKRDSNIDGTNLNFIFYNGDGKVYEESLNIADSK